MKNYKALIFALVVLFFSGCVAIPKQVVDAVDYQKQEIERVKSIYFTNLNNQLDAIEKYRLTILDIYKEQYIFQNSNALDMVTKDGKTALEETKPTGDKDVDYINIGKLEDIELFFESEKEKVRNDIKIRRDLINKANQNFENIEQVNMVICDYMKSLKRLKESQDKLAKSIGSNVAKLVSFPISFDQIPDPSTIEDIVKNLKTN